MFSEGDEVLWVPPDDHTGADPARAAVPRRPFAHAAKPARAEPAPREPWPATVRSVGEGGVCELDIRPPHQPGVTLHYRARHDEKKAPGTFHRKGD